MEWLRRSVCPVRGLRRQDRRRRSGGGDSGSGSGSGSSTGTGSGSGSSTGTGSGTGSSTGSGSGSGSSTGSGSGSSTGTGSGSGSGSGEVCPGEAPQCPWCNGTIGQLQTKAGNAPRRPRASRPSQTPGSPTWASSPTRERRVRDVELRSGEHLLRHRVTRHAHPRRRWVFELRVRDLPARVRGVPQLRVPESKLGRMRVHADGDGGAHARLRRVAVRRGRGAIGYVCSDTTAQRWGGSSDRSGDVEHRRRPRSRGERRSPDRSPTRTPGAPSLGRLDAPFR